MVTFSRPLKLVNLSERTSIVTEGAAAARICGFNPWPGPTMVEQAAERRRQAQAQAEVQAQIRQQQEEDRRRKEQELARGPAKVSNCDASGCWDFQGARYNKTQVSNQFHRSSGGLCQLERGFMKCN